MTEVHGDTVVDVEKTAFSQNCLLACIDALVPGGCPPELRSKVIHNTGDMHEVASMITLALYHAGWVPDIEIIPEGMPVADLFQSGVAVNNEHYPDGERFFGVLVQTTDILVPRSYDSIQVGEDKVIRIERHVVAGVPLASSPDGTICRCIDTLNFLGPRIDLRTSYIDRITTPSAEPGGMRGLLISGKPREQADDSDVSRENKAFLGDLEEKWQELVRHTHQG